MNHVCRIHSLTQVLTPEKSSFNIINAEISLLRVNFELATAHFGRPMHSPINPVHTIPPVLILSFHIPPFPFKWFVFIHLFRHQFCMHCAFLLCMLHVSTIPSFFILSH